MTRRLRTSLIGLLACLAAVFGLAGCGSSSADTPSDVPSSAEARTVPGAEAFAAHWVQALNKATVTGKTKPLMALSAPSCSVCKDFAQHLSKIYAAGGHVQTKGWQVKNVIPIAGQSLKNPGFQVTVIAAPQTVYASKNAKPQSYSGGQQGMRIFLTRSGDHWLVKKIEISQGS